MTTDRFLSYLRSLDIRLWSDGDRLRYSAPNGVLTPALRAELAERKSELLAFMYQAQAVASTSSQPIQPVPREGALPLSFAQQRLWFLDQLESGNPFYNVPGAIRLLGSLKVPALEQSLNEIIRRHEALRTTFATLEGKPIQVIAPELTIKLPVINLATFPQTEREPTARRLIIEETQKPFDLAKGPLLRAILLQLSQTEHILLITMHHIVSDLWSIGILIQEMAALYEALTNGIPPPLPDLPIQYADFAYWQQQQLRGEVLEELLAYWRQQLQGVPPMLNLPTDRPRPATQTYRGTSQSFLISKSVTEALKKLSQREGNTLFMTLLAAFKVLLYHHTGQKDLIVGTRIAGRDQQQTEGLIGFFVNALVLRTDLSGNPTFRELLGRVRQVSLAAYAHQDLPFEKLVEELQPERDPSHHPLFNVMFVLQTTPTASLQLPNLTLQPVGIDSQTSKYDLDLSIGEEADGLRGVLEYNTDLFEETTIDRMVNQFQTLLASIAANSEQRLSGLPTANVTLGSPDQSDRQVEIRGYRIWLEQVEKILNQHPAVLESLVAAAPTGPDSGNKRLIGYVVPAPEPPLTINDLHSFVKEKLPQYLLPSTFVMLETMPLDAQGKIDPNALPALDQVETEPEVTFVAPRTPVEEILAQIWADVLGVELGQMGIYHNFFELGGHSLLVTQVISRVLQVFQLELYQNTFELEGVLLNKLFEEPTIAGLAETLVKNETAPGQINTIAQLRQKINKMSADEIQAVIQNKKKAKGIMNNEP
jgi:hypothetical protein